MTPNWLIVCLSLVTWWCAVAPGVEGAGNIDVLEPIVRSSPAAEDSGDLFGYSVTLHQIRVPSSFQEALDSTRIIVGAPKGTYPGGLNLPIENPENQTGLVYNCPVTRGSCGRLGSGSGTDERLFDARPNTNVQKDITQNFNCSVGKPPELECAIEGKSQQLMGATVVSSGELFVACAPRYTIAEIRSQVLDTRRPIGRCFYSRRSLTEFTEMRPCEVSISISLDGGNLCMAGTSAIISSPPQGNGQVILGTPGYNSFSGGGVHYLVNSTSSELVYNEFNNPTAGDDTYEGYAVTIGRITGAERPDFILTVPRADGIDYRGTVVIRRASDLNLVQNDTRGTQFAEYFGWSVAAADLNNDGYDEIIVGAPLYSTTNIQEHGRVYVFKNAGGTLSPSDPVVLSGDTAARSRFGTSVTKLGDVNDDGYEDFAVGAPYQEVGSGNTGKVFIYYGSSAFTDDVADQTIEADDIVTSVTGLNQLKGFGWSLTSGVDVDNNEYSDLLVGAYESGTAVLFRALSVARINITVSTNLINNQLPIDLTASSPVFNLDICASFDGRGLTGQLVTTLNVDEMLVGGVRRLLFNGSSQYSAPLIFPGRNMEICTNVMVAIKDKQSLYSAGKMVNDFQIQFTLSQAPRTIPQGYDGNPANLTDLRDIPILVVSGNQSITVVPEVNCRGMDCRPDLMPLVQNYSYLSSITNKAYPDIVAGSTGVDTIIVALVIRNSDVDAAIGARFNISIPRQFSFGNGSTNTGATIECAQVDGGRMYSCNLPNFISGNTDVMVKLTWKRVQTVIIGNEENFVSKITVMVSDDRNPGNDEATKMIEFAAVADVGVTVLFPGTQEYNAEVPPSPITDYTQLGDPVILRVSLQNQGPSTLPIVGPTFVQLDIHLPTHDADTMPNFYLYPGTYTVTPANKMVTCDSNDFNPSGYEVPTPPTSGRRRRSAPSKRQTSDPPPQDSNPAPQDSNSIPPGSVIQNCSATPNRRSGCQGVINCTIRNWGPNEPITITIHTSIDRRFFSTRTTPFTFIAFANMSVVSPFARDDNKLDNQGLSNPFSIEREMEQRDNTTIFIVVSIVAVIGALLLLIALFCVLYFVGFFRRKKFGEEAEGDFEVRELPPEGTANGDKPVPPAEDEVGGSQEGTPTKEDPTTNDIGDAADLHDGEVAPPETDPDETSL